MEFRRNGQSFHQVNKYSGGFVRPARRLLCGYYARTPHFPLLLAITALLAAGPDHAQTPERPFTVSVDVDLVVFNATVLDSKGRMVKGLLAKSFHLFEDGKEQEIKFVQQEDVPATVGLVIDNSGSMKPKLSEVVKAALEFAGSSNPQDELFVVNFNERVFMGLPNSVPFTNSIDQLRSVLLAIQANGKTALYDAVAMALKHLDLGSHQKKALVVLSDGGDNASAIGLKDVLQLAQQSNATIYTIGIFDPDDADKNPKVLQQLATLSGGQSFLPKTLEELPNIWLKIAGGIRDQYTIGYFSTNLKHDGAFRNVRIVATDPNGKSLRVRARRGYAAPR